MATKLSAEEAVRFERYSAMNAGIVENSLPCGCKAYQDVFTYRRWAAQGMQVQKGQKAIKIGTYAPVTQKDKETGEVKVIGKRPWVSAVFCRHQVRSGPAPAATPAPVATPAPATTIQANGSTKYSTLKEYAPIGMIEQLPELKSTYSGKNPAGGRRAFCKSAGVGPLQARWERGIEYRYDIRVKLATNPQQLTLTIPTPIR